MLAIRSNGLRFCPRSIDGQLGLERIALEGGNKKVTDHEVFTLREDVLKERDSKLESLKTASGQVDSHGTSSRSRSLRINESGPNSQDSPATD